MFTSPSRAESLVVAALCLAVSGLAAQPARGQSLADVAKKEEERRHKVAEPTKVYTNKDLRTPAGPVVAAPAPSAPASDAARDAGTDAKTKAKGADADKDPTKEPAYWAGKLKTLQAQLDQDQAYAEAMQTRINSLTTDFVNRDDPAQRARIASDRQKAVADLTRLKKAIDDDKKAMAGFQEEARRAGIPPGWLR